MAIQTAHNKPEVKKTETIELEVKLNSEMQAQLDAPVSSIDSAIEFPDNSQRKETGFETSLDK